MKRNVIVIIVSILVGLMIGEALLRTFWLKDSTKSYFWKPYRYEVNHPKSSIFPGIYGSSVFSANSLGFRSAELPHEKHKKIITIGGSTTECFYLDQDETWPALLQEKLNGASNEVYWVGNMGKSGLRVGHHYIQTRDVLNDSTLEDIHMLILMVGVNDLLTYLADADYYLSDQLADLDRKIYEIQPLNKEPVHKQTAIWQLLRQVKRNVMMAKATQDKQGESYQTWRSYRQRADEVIAELPDLTEALELYENTLQACLALAKTKGVPIVFITQPTIWKNQMPIHEQDLLWMGGIGNYQLNCCSKYYSAEALAKGMEAFNHRLKEVVTKHAIENQLVFDLANRLSKDTTVFVDDCHFNENGAQMVANQIYGFIKIQETD